MCGAYISSTLLVVTLLQASVSDNDVSTAMKVLQYNVGEVKKVTDDSMEEFVEEVDRDEGNCVKSVVCK